MDTIKPTDTGDQSGSFLHFVLGHLTPKNSTAHWFKSSRHSDVNVFALSHLILPWFIPPPSASLAGHWVCVHVDIGAQHVSVYDSLYTRDCAISIYDVSDLIFLFYIILFIALFDLLC